MKCPAPERLAEAATTGDAALAAHVADCVACRAVLDEQHEVRAWLGGLAEPGLSRAHRVSLAAEVMARADALPAPRSRYVTPAIGAALAIAAIVAVIALLPRGGHDPIAVIPPPIAPATQVEPARTVAPEVEVPGPVAPVPAASAPAAQLARAKVGGTGEFAREGDVVKLAGGDVEVDAVGARAVSVVHGDTTVGVKGARVKITEKRGVIAQVAVFAGSAEITVGGTTVVIAQGMTWDRNAAREDSLAAFRTGWEELRAGRNAEAIAAFDQAADEVVAEDARYWAAVASERMQDREGAARRYRAFVAAFPHSPRIDAAKQAIGRLAPP